MRKKLGFFWRTGIWSILSLGFMMGFIAIVGYLYLASQLPDVDALKNVELQVPLQIFTKDGELIQEYGETRRIPLTYQQIPKTLVNALLVTEDQRFFEHSGVDIFGLGRAALKMLQTGTKSQGGSTITMQVARNFFLNRKKTFLRKFNEILLAIKIDQELPKEKILELYLNKIYLGNRAYGVGAAAQIYYGKEISQLTIAEMAMIAGLPQAPSAHNPIANPVAAKKRRNHVLARMFEEQLINEQEYQTAIAEPVHASYHGPEIQVQAPYVAEMIRQSLYTHFGEESYTQGIKVYTTIDSKLQNTANNLVEKHLLDYDKRHGYRGPVKHFTLAQNAGKDEITTYLKPFSSVNNIYPGIVINHTKPYQIILKDQQLITISTHKSFQRGDLIYVKQENKQWQLSQLPQIEAALISIKPQTGAIVALVGGFNFYTNKFNHVTQSIRQPGSSFKPFIYAAALNKGYSLASIVNDAPIVINDTGKSLWRPHNDNNTFNGPTRLREALAYSRNLVSIRLLDDIGIDYAIDFISRFGFKPEQIPHSLSLALGSLSVTPMELTTAYAAIANGGYKIEPYLIDHVTNRHNETLLVANPTVACDSPSKQERNCAQKIIPSDLAFLIHSALQSVIDHGTAKAARSLGRKDLAGKTGTTNEQVDAWFAGYHPDLVTVTWLGFDTPRPLHEYGSTLALPLWIDFMKEALKKLPQKQIAPPDNIVIYKINPLTGMRINSSADGLEEYFKSTNAPQDEDIEQNIPENPFPSDSQDSLF